MLVIKFTIYITIQYNHFHCMQIMRFFRPKNITFLGFFGVVLSFSLLKRTWKLCCLIETASFLPSHSHASIKKHTHEDARMVFSYTHPVQPFSFLTFYTNTMLAKPGDFNSSFEQRKRHFSMYIVIVMIDFESKKDISAEDGNTRRVRTQ